MLEITKSWYTGGATSDAVRVGRVRADDDVFDVAYVPPVGEWPTTGTNPEQLMGAAWAICFQGMLGVAGRNQGVDVENSRVTADIELGQTADGGFALGAVLTVSLPDVPQEQVDQLLDEAHALCPFVRAVEGNIKVVVNGKGR
ncbi:Ohr family peroxiredoxin [Streptomyces sp. NPDC002889]|uniref:Ohr family peroxiredoxin n=1 Tax=Streptomyces sp. NPDC002889 TaxID=3364669 RepID=UPI0036BC90FD